MDVLRLPAPYDRFLADLLARRGVAAADFPMRIDARDEMFFQGVLPGYGGDVGRAGFRYFESALRTFDIVGQLAGHLGGFPALERVLDFGSGWGRLTRRLAAVMPPERIWVSDLYVDAIAAQAEAWGVNAVCSVTRPDRFGLPGPFSLVFSASVFSHLPDGLFQAWLARLYALVAPRGLLAFSVHPTELLPEAERPEAGALAYHRTSESRTLSADIYGMAYTAPAYVEAAVAALNPARPPALRRFPRGLFENQDLYVVGGPDTDLADLTLDITPLVGMRPPTAEGKAVRFAGWGLDVNPGSRITRVTLDQDGARLGEAAIAPGTGRVLDVFPNAPNPPVQWSVSVPAARLAPGGLVRVTLEGRGSACAYAAAPYGWADPAAAART